MLANKKHVLVPLAPGFEEIEAVAIIDVLRRAELEVVVAGLAPGRVRGSHGITLAPDCSLADVDAATLDAVVLPGGMTGTLGLMKDERLLALLRELNARGLPTAAICAAPMVLAEAGLIDGVKVTSHPSVRDRLGAAEVVAAPRVVRSGTIWTSQGPGTAIEFALAIVEELCGAERASELAQAMVVGAPSAAAAR